MPVVGNLILQTEPQYKPTWEPRTFSRRSMLGWEGTFFGSEDIWSWGDKRFSPFDFPYWVWMFVGLCVLTSALFGVLGESLNRRRIDWRRAFR